MEVESMLVAPSHSGLEETVMQKQTQPNKSTSNPGQTNDQERRQTKGSEHNDGKSRTTQGNDQQSQQRRTTRDSDNE